MNGCRKCPAFDKCTVYEYRGSQYWIQKPEEDKHGAETD